MLPRSAGCRYQARTSISVATARSATGDPSWWPDFVCVLDARGVDGLARVARLIYYDQRVAAGPPPTSAPQDTIESRSHDRAAAGAPRLDQIALLGHSGRSAGDGVRRAPSASRDAPGALNMAPGPSHRSAALGQRREPTGKHWPRCARSGRHRAGRGHRHRGRVLPRHSRHCAGRGPERIIRRLRVHFPRRRS
jgi:hypothetical protein